MGLSHVSWIVLGVVLSATPALAQAQQCLHMGLENPAEVRRREDALTAARLINMAMERGARLPTQQPTYQTWEELVSSRAVASLRGMGGPLGDIARQMQWGSDEPLPGWEIHHVTRERAYAFSLTDTRDPCGFTYYSNDTGTIVEGHPIRSGGRGGIVPIT
jgi:hypothetical protein